MALNLDRFDLLTFDCFGTLIDWESGILAALVPLLRANGARASEDDILAVYAELESDLERAPYRPYRAVLRDVVLGFGRRFDFEPDAEEIASLERSLAVWPTFPDTVAALSALGGRYRLAVISNVDDELFVPVAKALGDPFDSVITAEQVGAYKPSASVFEKALELLGTPADAVLHVAQSLYHDIAPARTLGLSTMWVNRRKGKQGFGATPEASAEPDLEVPDLASLVAAVGLGDVS